MYNIWHVFYTADLFLLALFEVLSNHIVLVAVTLVSSDRRNARLVGAGLHSEVQDWSPGPQHIAVKRDTECHSRYLEWWRLDSKVLFLVIIAICNLTRICPFIYIHGPWQMFFLIFSLEFLQFFQENLPYEPNHASLFPGPSPVRNTGHIPGQVGRIEEATWVTGCPAPPQEDPTGAPGEW